jgi:hypothetical protein
VLLSVSNQPVWSDTWTLGGLFLASGLTGSAALLAASSRGSGAAEVWLRRMDAYFALLELLWIALLLIALNAAGTLFRLGGSTLLLLWLVVALGLAVPLLGSVGRRGAVASGVVAAVIVLAGVLALRAVVIFGPQM